MGMLFTSFLLLVLPWCQWHRQLGVAAVLVGAAADVVLVQTDLGREADQRPVSRLHVVGVEAPAVNGGKRADVRNHDKLESGQRLTRKSMRHGRL